MIITSGTNHISELLRLVVLIAELASMWTMRSKDLLILSYHILLKYSNHICMNCVFSISIFVTLAFEYEIEPEACKLVSLA